MYRVIRDFSDSCDSKTIYRVGDTFPRSGYKPEDGRIKELLGTGNKQGVPLIEEIVTEPKEKKRRTAKGKNNADVNGDLSGTEKLV